MFYITQPLDNHLISAAHCPPYFICCSHTSLILIDKPCQDGFHLWDFTVFSAWKSFTPDKGLVYSFNFFKFTSLSPYKRGLPNLTYNIVSSPFCTSLSYFAFLHSTYQWLIYVSSRVLPLAISFVWEGAFHSSLPYPQCQNQCLELNEHLLRWIES